MASEPAQPLYQSMLEMVAECGDPVSRGALSAEMWRPVVQKHSPAGSFVGQPCAGCGDPWPCKTLRDVLGALD